MATGGDRLSWEQAVQWLRSQPDKRELVLGAYYDDPVLAAAMRYWQGAEWRAIRQWLPAVAGRALDVGAGRGIASYALAREGYSVVALEPDPSPLVGTGAIRSLAADARLPIEICQHFSETLPFEDCQFDVVFARAALHHIGNLASAASEFHRVLKPGGRLIAVREHVISRRSDLPAFLASHPLHSLYGGENALLLSGYQDAIRQAGFALTKVIAPFESPINMAPQTDEGLKREICDRAGRLGSGLPAVAGGLMRIPGVWPLMRRAMSVVDRRPGRLYSFIADRS